MRSELAISVFPKGNLIAVLDIDSDLPDVFTLADQEALERILKSSF